MASTCSSYSRAILKQILFLFALLCSPAVAQQINSDVIPASSGLNLGHSNQRWNGYFQNVDIKGTCFFNGVPCGTGSGSGPTPDGDPTHCWIGTGAWSPCPSGGGGGVSGPTTGGGLVLSGSTLGLRTDCSDQQIALWNAAGSAWVCAAIPGGLADPGGNGIVKRTGVNTTSIAVAGDYPTLNQSTSGTAAKATAAVSAGTECSAGQAARGVDASWNARDCFAPPGGIATVSGTTNQVTVTSGANPVASIPNPFNPPGDMNVGGILNLTSSSATQLSGVLWAGTSVTVPSGKDYSFGIGSDDVFRCQLSAALGGGTCMPGGLSITTVSGLASVSGKTKGTIAVVTDGNSATDCTTGTGTTVVTCQYSGSTWASFGGSNYTLPAATSSTLGGVKPDGTSILNTAGAISATAASVGALGLHATADLAASLSAILALSLGGTHADLSATGDAVNSTGKQVLVQGADHAIGPRALIAADLPTTLQAGTIVPLCINPQTGNYVAAIGDAVCDVQMNITSTANTFTVPPNSGGGSVAFPIGTILVVTQHGTGQTTLVGGSGVTINTSSSLIFRAQFSKVSIEKIGTNEWDASGDLQ